MVRDRNGKIVPSQLLDTQRDPAGNLVVTDVTFVAKDIPSLGYDTFAISFTPTRVRNTANLTADQATLVMQNEFIRVKLDTATGAIQSLVDRHTGKEMLRQNGGEYPVFKGSPDPGYPLRGNIPAGYDSSTAKPLVTWTETGPVRYTVRSRYSFRYLQFETDISLCAGRPYVDVTSRVLADMPPQRDDDPKEIKRGYWLSFAPSFKPQTVVRDYPLAVEETTKPQFHALNFVDLDGNDSGLLVLHPGTQFFRFEKDGSLSNLIMREWESYYSGEWGWPRYSEYHHALEPHGAAFGDADRLRASTNFSQSLFRF